MNFVQATTTNIRMTVYAIANKNKAPLDEAILLCYSLKKCTKLIKAVILNAWMGASNAGKPIKKTENNFVLLSETHKFLSGGDHQRMYDCFRRIA